ncbi:MAG: hypothetical protein LLG97_08275 [Deltaproteobacteria bacterium]|nr:hypothetical protein [Deltaproteobacteria bacterium]
MTIQSLADWQDMFDVLIIGRDLSSLIAAIASVRKGRKTVLLLEGDSEPVHFEEGYAFPPDPRPLPGLADQEPVSHLLKDLLPSDEILSTDSPMDLAFQVILSGHRIDVFRDPELLVDDLIREFPEQTEEIKRFYRSLSKTSGTIERWIREDGSNHSGLVGKFFRLLSRLPIAISSHFSLAIKGDIANDPFRQVVEAQFHFLSNLDIEGRQFPLSAAYLLSLPMKGLYHPVGGIPALMARLQLAFTELGGILKDRCSVIRVATEPHVVVDLECEGSSTTLTARKLIISAQWEKIELLLPGRKILPRGDRYFASIRPAAYPFFLHMGVHEKALPENMAEHALLLGNGTGPVRNREFVFLQTSRPGEINCAPEGRRAITAMVYLNRSPLLLSDQDLKDEAMRIIDSLEEFLPFLRENIDCLRVDQSIDLSRKYQEMVARKYRTGRTPFWGLRTLDSRTRIENVLLTGGILRAGLGLEGEIIAGMDAAFSAGKGEKDHG